MNITEIRENAIVTVTLPNPKARTFVAYVIAVENGGVLVEKLRNGVRLWVGPNMINPLLQSEK